jgi:ABC-type sugar transport system ATPase subunit
MNGAQRQEDDPQGQLLLRATSISKRFGGVVALEGADFEIRAGEHVALVGDNGAGKSTLVHVLSGALRPDSGLIWFDGQERTFGSPGDAKKAGIETAYQHLAIVDQLDVVANLFVGRELALFGFGPLSVPDHKAMRQQARELLARTGVQIQDLHVPLRSLSGGQRQSVAIARAAGWGSKLIILDEPTAALGVQETRKVETIIGGLKSQHIAALIVSHNLRQVFALADSVFVMRRGRVVGHLQTEACEPEDIVRLITGADEATAMEFV